MTISIPGLSPRRRPLERLVDLAFAGGRKILTPLIHPLYNYKSGHLAWTSGGHLALSCASTVQQARYCPVGTPSGGALANLYIPTGSLPSPFTSKYYVNVGGGACYYFDPADPPIAYTSQPLIGSFTSITSCAFGSCTRGPCGCQAGFSYTTVTVSFSGLTYANCVATGGVAPLYWQQVGSLTTYSGTASPGCNMPRQTSAVLLNAYNDSGCTSWAGSDGAFVNVLVGPSIQVTAFSAVGNGPKYFSGTAVSRDCSNPIVIPNDYTAIDGPTEIMAAGGTATVTLS